MDLGHIGNPAPNNFDAGPARADFELFDPNRHDSHSWISQ